MRIKTFNHAALAAIALFAALPSAVAAQEHSRIVMTGDGPVARVSYTDLDLGSRQGLATLQDRVREAARRLCRRQSVEPLGIYMAKAACRKNAVADAAGLIEIAAAKFGDTRFAAALAIDVAVSK